MVYKEFSDVNASEGVQTLFVYVNEVTNGLFSAMLLFSLFMIILLATFFSAKRTSGGEDANFPASFAIAGFITASAAIVMSFVDGLMNITTLVVAIVVSTVGLVWLFFPNKE